MDKTSSMYLYVKLNWDANRFLPAESKDCMNSTSYEYRNMSAKLTLTRKGILTPTSLRNELRNCYDIYSYDFHHIDTRLIKVAYMKFTNFCVYWINNY